MTAEQLRNSILQEAISGRLVPQDPNDEPASALLARIREEKARLVKEGKLKKKDLVETPITEEEIPFEIPKGWEWSRWGNLAFSIMYGYNAPAEDSGDIRMVRISDIQGNKVLWDKVPFCRINPKDIDAYLLRPNDILFARTGGTVGKSYIVTEVPYPSIYAGYLIRTQYSKQLCPQYLKYFMESQLYWSQLRDETIATAQPNCNGKKLAAMILPIPPLAEQKRIVAKLEELLPIVEQYGKAQKELDELNAALPARLRQSILQEAISGRLVPQDPNDEPASVLLERLREERCNRIKLGEIKLSKPEKALRVEITNDFELPISWTWCVLNDVCRAFGRIGYRGYTKEDIVTVKEKGAIAISPSNMENNRLKLDVCTYISEAKYLESPEIMLENGDILLTKTASVGKLALVEDLPWKATINPQIAVLKEISIDRKYLTYALASPYIQDIIHGFTIGTSIPTYSQEKMIGINIPLPPLAEQQRIVAKIEELFAEIDKLQANN